MDGGNNLIYEGIIYYTANTTGGCILISGNPQVGPPISKEWLEDHLDIQTGPIDNEWTVEDIITVKGG